MQRLAEVQGREGAPAVVALGGISANRHVASHAGDTRPGWWESFAGPGRAVDTERYRVVGADYLADGGKPVDTFQQAIHLAKQLDAIGVERAHALIGSSYGGMVALAFGALFPTRVGRLVLISATHESHPMATAWRVIQRRITRLGIEAGRPAEGLGLARALAVTTYRTADEFAERFEGSPTIVDESPRWPVESYLDHQADRFSRDCLPERFLALSESIDLHRVNPESVMVPCTLVAVHGDVLTPPWQIRELHQRLGGSARLVEINSIYGHDAFLKEVSILTPVIADALDGSHD